MLSLLVLNRTCGGHITFAVGEELFLHPIAVLVVLVLKFVGAFLHLVEIVKCCYLLGKVAVLVDMQSFR